MSRIDIEYGSDTLVIEVPARCDVKAMGAAVALTDSAAAIRDSLFTPFITTRQEGTGLGLAVVHQIVVEHGGSIGVESEPPWGTIFRIRLPLPPADVSSPGPA